MGECAVGDEFFILEPEDSQRSRSHGHLSNVEEKNATYCEIKASQIIEGKLSWALSEMMELGGQKGSQKQATNAWLDLEEWRHLGWG